MSNSPNPKDALGIKKPSAQFTSPLAELWMHVAMQEGAGKYGPFNWRQHPIDPGVYYSAARRHWGYYMTGETHDPKTGVHHLGYAMACAAIVIDAEAMGCLVNREVMFDSGQYAAAMRYITEDLLANPDFGKIPGTTPPDPKPVDPDEGWSEADKRIVSQFAAGTDEDDVLDHLRTGRPLVSKLNAAEQSHGG